MSCSSSVTKAGLYICQPFCNLQAFQWVFTFKLYTQYVNASQQTWLQVNGWIGLFFCWIFSICGSKRVPLSVQLDKAAAEGLRLENVCHSFSVSPLYRDMTESHRVWFLWVQDSLHCFFKVCLLETIIFHMTFGASCQMWE